MHVRQKFLISKDSVKRLIFKIGTIYPHYLNERFYFIWSFIVFVFVQHVQTKAVISYIFTPLFMSIQLPLIHFACLPRLLIDFKSAKWLTYFWIWLYIIVHLLLFLLYKLLFLLYKFTRFFIYFLSLSDEGPALETLDYTVHTYRKYTNLFIFRFVLQILPSDWVSYTVLSSTGDS